MSTGCSVPLDSSLILCHPQALRVGMGGRTHSTNILLADVETCWVLGFEGVNHCDSQCNECHSVGNIRDYENSAFGNDRRFQCHVVSHLWS